MEFVHRHCFLFFDLEGIRLDVQAGLFWTREHPPAGRGSGLHPVPTDEALRAQPQAEFPAGRDH